MTHFRNCAKFANIARPMFEYIKGRPSIDDETFHTINWVSIGKIHTSHPIGQRVQTIKMMYRWLPVGHNLIKCNLEMDNALVAEQRMKHSNTICRVNMTISKELGKWHNAQYKPHMTMQNPSLMNVM